MSGDASDADNDGVLSGDEIVAAKGKNSLEVTDRESILEADWRWKIADRVARSGVLWRATQLREILLYIVRQSILNPDEPIHEFEIAHHALGRRSDFNPLDDNIVRVQMAHLRKKLDLYFSTEGKHEDTVITVALGTYKPLFAPRIKLQPALQIATDTSNAHDEIAAPAREDVAAFELPPALAEMQAASAGHRRISLPTVTAVAVILVLAATSFELWVRGHHQQEEIDSIHRSLAPWRYQPALNTLWSGFFDSNRDTDVVLSDDAFLLIEELNKQQTPFYGYLGRSYLNSPQQKTQSPDQRFALALLAEKSLGNTSEFKLAQRILALDPLDKRIHLYSARQYMPALVKQDNVILIGGRISNPWAELFESQLNFTEQTRFEGLGTTTVENRSPASGEPHIYASTDAVGYCVVAYLPNPDHDGKVLLLEGTSAEATEAAGDFLLGDKFSAFRDMLHTTSLPYFEVLLKTSQVRGTPLSVTVEAYRTYPALSRSR